MAAAERDERAWHALEPDAALEALDARREGLSEDEVEERRERFGPNELPRRRRAGPVRIFLRQFKDPLIYILLVAGVVSLAAGTTNNAIFIFAVLLINAIIGTLQEWRSETSAEALQETVRIRVRVRRGGRETEVDGRWLVPGDVVRVESGSAVPADLRLLEAKELRADESLLTGESEPVDKSAEACEEDAALGDRHSLLHAGTQVLSGRGMGLTCRTGRRTEVGVIARSLAEEEQLPPLVLRLQSFTRRIAVAVLAAVSVLAVMELGRGRGPEEIFLLAVALAVSAIPAGLPVAITVALSIASTRMARRHVIVRKLAAVEGLGSATLVASDKTGTITANALTVRQALLPGSDAPVEISGEGYEPEGEATRDGEALSDEDREALERLAASGALTAEGTFERAGDEQERASEDEGDEEESESKDESGSGEVRAEGDPVDVAFLVLAAKLGKGRDELVSRHEQVGFLPFESERRFAASFHREDGRVVAHVKGAAEAVASMCRDVDAEELGRTEEELAGRGLRVLACARGEVDFSGDEPDPEALRNLDFLGLAGLVDPVREEVPEAIERCRSAGVDVRMITGDHPATALQVACAIGLAGEDAEDGGDGEGAVASGRDLAEKGDDPEALAERIRDVRVFARIEPTQKTGIVRALQHTGAFVAVTGDGVNDAPALRAAHVGVSMGQGGTDVARNASDLILTDDNFASLVNGIEEGRVAYDNVRKVIWLLLSTGAGEVLLFFLAILTGLPLPLTPVQLLWLNLVTNGIQDVALAFEKGEPGVLERPPRRPDEPIFDRRMLQQVAASGGYIGAVAFGVYWWLLESAGLSPAEATNLLLLLMVLFENIHAFSCRSETRSAFRVPFRANPLLVGAVVLAQGIHVAAMWTPGLSDVLGASPVSFQTWLTLLPIAASLLLFDEAAKWLHRRAEGRAGSGASR